jgi:hypothetical protein
MVSFHFQDPAGIFELIEVVGNGTYGQVYKVRNSVFYNINLYCFTNSCPETESVLQVYQETGFTVDGD